MSARKAGPAARTQLGMLTPRNVRFRTAASRKRTIAASSVHVRIELDSWNQDLRHKSGGPGVGSHLAESTSGSGWEKRLEV